MRGLPKDFTEYAVFMLIGVVASIADILAGAYLHDSVRFAIAIWFGMLVTEVLERMRQRRGT